MKDFVVTTTLGQRNDVILTTRIEPEVELAGNKANTGQQTQSNAWYIQLYLPVVDTIIEQLRMRFTQDTFDLAKAHVTRKA